MSNLAVKMSPVSNYRYVAGSATVYACSPTGNKYPANHIVPLPALCWPNRCRKHRPLRLARDDGLISAKVPVSSTAWQSWRGPIDRGSSLPRRLALKSGAGGAPKGWRTANGGNLRRVAASDASEAGWPHRARSLWLWHVGVVADRAVYPSEKMPFRHLAVLRVRRMSRARSIPPAPSLAKLS
jgi:hypothetical protein